MGEKLGIPYTTSLDSLTAEADIYMVCVKDDALPEVLPKVASRNPDALFVHTAGSVALDVWEGLAKRYAVAYPMQTFSKGVAIDFSDIPFFVEARYAHDAEALQQILSNLSTKVYKATTEQRKYLHLAAVFACNFTNHMYAIAAQIMEENKLPFEALLPLIDETARKVHTLPPTKAQTGPAVRRDRTVMRRQLDLLEDDEMFSMLYKLISMSIENYREPEEDDADDKL